MIGGRIPNELNDADSNEFWHVQEAIFLLTIILFDLLPSIISEMLVNRGICRLTETVLFSK